MRPILLAGLRRRDPTAIVGNAAEVLERVTEYRASGADEVAPHH
jgi:hypothetical protein